MLTAKYAAVNLHLQAKLPVRSRDSEWDWCWAFCGQGFIISLAAVGISQRPQYLRIEQLIIQVVFPNLENRQNEDLIYNAGQDEHMHNQWSHKTLPFGKRHDENDTQRMRGKDDSEGASANIVWLYDRGIYARSPSLSTRYAIRHLDNNIETVTLPTVIAGFSKRMVDCGIFPTLKPAV